MPPPADGSSTVAKIAADLRRVRYPHIIWWPAVAKLQEVSVPIA